MGFKEKRPSRRVDAEVVRRLIERLFVAAGCRAEHAAVMADVFLEADLRGHAIQGLDHIQSPLRDVQSGRIDGNARPRIARDRSCAMLVDGGGGLGPVAATFAADTAIRKARAGGSGIAGILNASDVFMVGYYVDRIARQGLIGLAFTNSPALVHAHGGNARVLGTNPLAIGIPIANADPIVLDMATSAIAAGLIRLAEYYDEAIPEGLAFDPDGNPTRDARVARRGAIHPLAGHKGSGLCLMIGLLSGPLVGAALGRALQGWILGFGGGTGPVEKRGHLIAAVDPAAFGDPAAFRAASARYVGAVKGSRKAPGVEDILVPGERGFRNRAKALREGVAIAEAVWQNTARIASDLGVPMPD
ncbi:MAG: Ldh family oxidoreductase [Rhodospirillales bacterium]|nr:Ldh family oxidoreductase [Rhodospirillales bacterium]